MKIREVFSTSYVIRYIRGNDIQSTEVVDTTADEILSMVAETFKDRLSYPNMKNKGKTNMTTVKVVELDHLMKRSSLLKFVYYRSGRTMKLPYVLVENFSPRETRIRLEKAIKNKVCD